MDELVQEGIEEKKYIKGQLLRMIYQNEAEHFSIAKIKVQDTTEDFKEKEVVIKGYFSALQEQTTYYFYGTFEKHVKFGLQYTVHAYKTFIPSTKDGLISYLSSELFYGIGKKTAKKVVNHLGESAISKILNQPDCLDDIPGLKKETKQQLVKSLQENQGFENVVVHLAKYSIGLKMAQKIYKVYQDSALEVLEEDPYQYVFEIEGFGFQTADEIAKQKGLSVSHPNRIGAGCVFVLQKTIQDGHVFLPIDECVHQVLNLLNARQELTESSILEILESLNQEKQLILKEGRVYLPSLYYAEDGFSSRLKKILQNEVDEKTSLAELMKIIGVIEEEETLSYGKEQFNAINKAIDSKVLILTGGPGTGKTTVIKGILKAYGAIHSLSLDPNDYKNKTEFPFILTAPTGRAAKRLSESTQLPAVTIHRLLGWNGNEFDKDEHEQLQGKYIIVDEFSMVDIWLANHLFKAIPDDMQVLLVGDEDQLPSVGPGQVLSDLLSSELIPSVTLNEVYRQKEGSKIIQLAHDIKNNNCTPNSLSKDKDFSFISCSESQMIGCITQIVNRAYEKGIDLNDIQVLAPMYRSQTGITMINKELQLLINPKTKRRREVKVHDVIYRVGDRVIQLVNQPEDGVYNGDIGEIVAIFRENENTENEEQIVISFDEREVVYVRKEYDNFMHAYCISIHKSQGSEFPIVILPVVSSYHRMLRKNLLYTAITRSKESLIICGETNAFFRGIQTIDTNNRFTSLKEHLQEKLEKEDMEELTPYDFM
ncbi:ATP-dependent RecD-like DNA helicase [Oceanobacillus piezotolerans]|uniref:ATP-dependent RecD2 DNA helicase n=1 Tax=Oceanobacillus piezotolerans TaxID=2448030 RepID=A0A498DLT6_9BACI|nr:ATP-dependent RecD-like DNA helicase [Oceanobacillus piezotolerans]RLL48000.1 ATP-dependent RecD-like DNA helicase [Oceanobacillus piezotolerans]